MTSRHCRGARSFPLRLTSWSDAFTWRDFQNEYSWHGSKAGAWPQAEDTRWNSVSKIQHWLKVSDNCSYFIQLCLEARVLSSLQRYWNIIELESITFGASKQLLLIRCFMPASIVSSSLKTMAQFLEARRQMEAQVSVLMSDFVDGWKKTLHKTVGKMDNADLDILCR